MISVNQYDRRCIGYIHLRKGAYILRLLTFVTVFIFEILMYSNSQVSSALDS